KPTGAHRVAKRAVDHGHGVTRSRRKRPRRLCRPPSPLGRSGRPLALLLSSLFACSETLLSRFLVASPPVQDLLLSAKYLFGAARTVCHGLQCDIGCIFSSLYPSLAVPLLSRLAPSQRLVALRQTFVHRCHLPAGGSLPSGTASHFASPQGSRWPRHTVPCASAWHCVRPAHGFPPIRRGCRPRRPWARTCSAGARRNGSRRSAGRCGSCCCACTPCRWHWWPQT